MTEATLLEINGDGRVWTFEHAMAHRPWVGTWTLEYRGNYSAVPYLIGNHYKEPLPDTDDWRLWHQQSHWDSLNAPPSPMGPFTAPVTQVLWMSGPSDPDQRKWWTFANFQEHTLASQNIAQNAFPLAYPFW